MPSWMGVLGVLLWPLLGMLLYATFTQVPLSHLREAFRDARFVSAAVTGNFAVLPFVVWGLVAAAPDDPAVRLGVLLVLLVPCTDWFITFTHLGGGDTKHAIVFSPISLLLQVMLLPVYLWLFLGEIFTTVIAQQEMLIAFSGLILLPLLAAFLTEKWAAKSPSVAAFVRLLTWFPVPLLAIVLFAIAATQVGLVMESIGLLWQLLVVFVAFLVVASVIARILARAFKLPATQGRVLAFSFGTRNSFVVLPLALALPSSFELAVVAIVFQSLVELVGMVVYLWWVPNKLFPVK
ncbi:arsenic resistance protein [Nitrosomonas halophila]|uniref:arsenic resistance protein n=1 Tax=Nitrosomonas halophila TaxID=44576 RepID=UPI001FDF330A|nr:arsenic resistance protein [Nitrosomonas halophila]